MAVTLGTSATSGGSEPISPGAGLHDVDLLRDIVVAGETLTLRAELPAFVLVTDGTLAAADGTSIASGATATLDGAIALTNNGPDPAAVVIGMIDQDVLDIEAPTTPSEPSTPSQPAAPPSDPSTADSTSTTTTTAPVDTDADGDGLTDGEEADLGTDPLSADGDNDDLDY